MKKLLLICLLTVIHIYVAYGQTDTSFWFAVPYVTKYHSTPNPVLRIASKKANVVTISQPGNTAGTGVNLTVPLAANSNHNIDLLPFIQALTDSFPNRRGDNALFIKSEEPITVYYDYAGLTNSEIFALKGTNALGSEFYIASQNTWHVDHNPDIGIITNPKGWWQKDANSTLDIVATEDGTEIEITPKANGIDDDGNGNRTLRSANVAYIITLNKGETYTLQSESTDNNKLLFGTHIKTLDSNKKIAVTIKDDSVKDGDGTGTFGYDLIGDQLVPINIIGSQYIVMKGFTGNEKNGIRDKVFIVVTEDNTTLVVDGVNRGDFNKGDTVSFKVNNKDATFISSDKGQSFYVYQVTGFNNELGSALLPPVKCTGSDSVSFVRSRNDNLVLTILVRDGGQHGFRFNGSLGVIKASDFIPLTNTPTGEEWLVAKYDSASAVSLSVDSGKVATISNDQYYFHLGILEGRFSSSAKFGYFSDFGKLNADYFKGENLLVCHDSLPVFTVSNPKLTPSWTNGNVFNNGRSFSPTYPGGKVVLTINDKRGCEAKDSINIGFYNDIRVKLTGNGTKDSLICFGSEFNALARVRNPTDPNAVEFFWQGNNFPVPINSLTIRPTPGKDTTVFVKVKDVVTGCRAFDTVTFKQRGEILPLNLKTDSTTCWNNPDELRVSPQFKNYEWRFNNTIIHSSSKDSVIFANQPDDGNYLVTVTDEYNCKKSDSAYVEFIREFSLNLGPSETIVCDNENVPFAVGPKMGYDYLWHNGSTDTFFVANKSELVKVTKTSKRGGCELTASTNVDYNRFNKLLKADTTICPEASLNLTVIEAPNYTNYVWQDGSPGFHYKVQAGSPGIYWVEYTVKNKCKYKDTVSVRNFTLKKLDIGKDTIACFYAKPELKAGDKGDFKTFKWSPSGEDSYSITPQETGAWSVFVTDYNNCRQHDAINVTYVPINAPSLTPADTTLCFDQEFYYSVGRSYNAYKWQDSTSTNYFYKPKLGDSLIAVKVSMTQGNTTCYETSNTVRVNIIPQIDVSFNSIKDPICSFDDIELIASTNYNYTIPAFKWDDGTEGPVIKPKKEGRNAYTVTVTGANGCSANSSKTISYWLTLPTALPNYRECEGTEVAFAPVFGYTNWTWKNDRDSIVGTDSIFKTKVPGFYSVELKSVCGDTTALTFYIAKPNPQLDTLRDTVFCLDIMNPLYLDVNKYSDSYSFAWNKKPFPDVINTSNRYYPVEGGKYFVTVTDTNGCFTVDSVTVAITDSCFKIPNLITPNGDDKNQTFEVKGISRDTWELTVFNRWGDRVYYRRGYNNDWEANDVTDGVYYYLLANPYTNEKIKGWVQVLGKGGNGDAQ